MLLTAVIATGVAALLLSRTLHQIQEKSQVTRHIQATELAKSLAEALIKGREFTSGHPYYGGMGFRYSEGIFVFGSINDGYIWSPSEERAELEQDKNRMEFSDRAGFESWVAERLCEKDFAHSHPWLSLHALKAAAL